MVKGVSRRIVVVEPPDRHLFEQAIFIVRDGAPGEGVTSRALVEEARRVARDYAGEGQGRFARFRRKYGALACTALGASLIGMIWAAVSLWG